MRRCTFGIQRLSRWLLSFMVAAIACVGLAQKAKTPLVVWGEQNGADTKGFDARLRLFEEKFPQYKVSVLSMGAGAMNPQKLMTAIVGRVPPDVVFQDRFTISDWASRGAFQDLTPFIERDRKTDPTTPSAEQYYPATWQESMYDNKVYGIPYGSDDRILYYNKEVFRSKANELRAAGLDPERPPRTWSEVLAYSKVLTEKNPDGTLKRAGWIPNFGNTWLYLFSFQMNGSLLSPDGRTATFDTPQNRDALKFMIDGYDILGGYDEAQKFQSSQKGGSDDALIVGNIAMKVDGDWIMKDLAVYGVNLDFGVAPAPVPDDRFYQRGVFANEKDKFITWIGGFAYVIPKGARNPEAAWDYIKFMCSDEAWRTQCAGQQAWEQRRGRILVPRVQARASNNAVTINEFMPKLRNVAAALKEHIAMMPYGRVRPATPVGQVMWDEHVRALEFACRKERSAQEALQVGQSVVQKELDAVYNANQYPVVDMRIPSFVGLAGAIFGIGIFVGLYQRQKLGQLGRAENRWAYFFIAPWLIGFIGFTLGPMLASLFFSFTQYNVLSDPRWVGMKNYSELVHDEQHLLVKSFMNVFYLGGIGVPLGLFTGLGIALLLNNAVRGINYYRTAFYLPSIVPAVASVVLWVYILAPDPNRGLMNGLWVHTIQQWFGVAPPGWSTVEHWAKPVLLVQGLWGAGGGMVLWLAGLKGVPTSLYEAASIDGATPRQQFWSITIPQLTPLIFFNTVMGFIGAIQTFDSVFVMTGGENAGPSDALLTPVLHLFRNGFNYFRMGYCSALAWAIFGIILVITGLQFWMSRRWVHYEVTK